MVTIATLHPPLPGHVYPLDGSRALSIPPYCMAMKDFSVDIPTRPIVFICIYYPNVSLE
jgi:hypothetical protein